MTKHDEQRTISEREAYLEAQLRMFAAYMVFQMVNRFGTSKLPTDQFRLAFFQSSIGKPLVEAAMSEIGGSINGDDPVDKTTGELVIDAYKVLAPDCKYIALLEKAVTSDLAERNEKAERDEKTERNKGEK